MFYYLLLKVNKLVIFLKQSRATVCEKSVESFLIKNLKEYNYERYWGLNLLLIRKQIKTSFLYMFLLDKDLNKNKKKLLILLDDDILTQLDLNKSNGYRNNVFKVSTSLKESIQQNKGVSFIIRGWFNLRGNSRLDISKQISTTLFIGLFKNDEFNLFKKVRTPLVILSNDSKKSSFDFFNYVNTKISHTSLYFFYLFFKK